ncbi:MAG TPA: LamG domain-containing protein [Acidobacteriota bacterium]|nr:LamG domain-containing protein [Acidobacteriota bacterium]
MIRTFLSLVAAFVFSCGLSFSQTTALWLFDEQVGVYPSSVLNDSSENDYPMVIGPGGQIVPGKFGNALDPVKQPDVEIPPGPVLFGLQAVPTPEGRTVEPMTWMNAGFCALMTSGENHLRKEVGFASPTKTKLNLGSFDWTVEFWFLPSRRTGEEGVVFEIGQGPRGENDHVTRLTLDKNLRAFTLYNQPSGRRLTIKSDERALRPENSAWRHLAFVYSSSGKTLSHYVDGKLQSRLTNVTLKSLQPGDEDYMSVGRDGLWKRPLQGRIDELRFSEGALYQEAFTPPGSFAPVIDRIPVNLVAGPPLLFPPDSSVKLPIQLGSRKHLFIDDALLEEMKDIEFVVNPPRPAERVIDQIEGQFRKHLTVVEDEDGLIRIFNSIHDDYLAVRTSRDGVHFERPNTGKEYRGQPNIVIHEPVGGLGNPFIDPNGPPEMRWKYITGLHNRGIYLYTSPDGWNWRRHKTYLLPFKSGTQSATFYDDQRQLYVGYHRTGIGKTPAGDTQRESVRTEVRDLFKPWDFTPVTSERSCEIAKTKRLRDPQPWYLDNGPLTPGGFGLEFPFAFEPDENLDPVGTDIYLTKAIKYPWAPDAYFAFPVVYFHYENDGPLGRQILGHPSRNRGSGPLETQIAVSRDGVNWKRYPRPAYVGIGMHEGRDVNTAYLAMGMVRRGTEIWQYYFGETQYHSAWKSNKAGQAVYRLVQRLDGFISANSPYDREAIMKTKPLVFTGNRLVLNIDTDAAGYAQVGFLDENDRPIEGFSVDDCVYINGDFVDAEVEWMRGSGTSVKDVSSLAGRTVRLVFRMRGARLFSMQFVGENTR